MSGKLITRLNPRSILPENSRKSGNPDPAAKKRSKESRGTETRSGRTTTAVTALDVAGGCAALTDFAYFLLLVRQAGHLDMLPRWLDRAAIDWPEFIPQDSPLHNGTDGPIVLVGAIYRTTSRAPCTQCRGFGTRTNRKVRTARGWKHFRGVCDRCRGKGETDASDARVALRLGIARTTYRRKYGKAIDAAVRMIDQLETRADNALRDQVYKDRGRRPDLEVRTEISADDTG